MTASTPHHVSARIVPYIGPRPFTREDVLFGFDLYGRNWEVDQLTDLLVGKRIVLLHAPSGAGKTSLIQAKLIPRLEGEEFDVLPTVRVGLEPDVGSDGTNRYVLSTLRSLDAEVLREPLASEADRLVPTLKSVLDSRLGADMKPQLLIFDQFEEILTADPTDWKAREEFFAQLAVALRDRTRWALFAIREDYVAALEPYARVLPTRLATSFRLDLLGAEAASDAIQRPAQVQAGVSFTPGAINQSVDDLRRVRVQRVDGPPEERLGPYVEPVQLQVVCRRLWEKLPPGIREISEADLGTVGQVDTALGDYYAERVRETAEATGVSERRIRAWFEEGLIAKQGIRGQILKGVDESDGLSNRAIQRLVDAHLVRAESRRGLMWYELAHDRLINPVRADNAAWLQVSLNSLQHQARVWEQEGRSGGLLFRDRDLVEAERWAATHPDELMPVDEDFLEASRHAREAVERELREIRRRRLSWVVGLLAIAAAVAAVLFLYLWTAADKAKAAAEAAKVRAEATQTQAEAAKVRAEATQTQAEAAALAAMVRAEATKSQAEAVTVRAEATRTQAEAVTVQAEAVTVQAEATRTQAEDDRRSAEAAKVQAMSNVLKLKALALVNDQPDLALLLGLRAKQMNSAIEVRDILLGGLGYIRPTAFLRDHTYPVLAVAFSPDGGVLASGASNGVVILSDLSTGRPFQVLAEHTRG